MKEFLRKIMERMELIPILMPIFLMASMIMGYLLIRIAYEFMILIHVMITMLLETPNYPF